MSAVIHLQALGLTEYEARAYTALLALGRSVPARVARQAGIPRPKIYETLERLEGRGLASKVGQSPLEYAPLSAREYLTRSRRSFSDRLEALDRDLSRLTPDPAPEAVYHLNGEAALRSLCEDLILNATRQVYMAGVPVLADRLEALCPRGVALTRADLVDLPPIAAAGQHAFLLTRDAEAAVIAHFVPEDADIEAHGVHTHNPVIIHLIDGYVTLAAQQSQQPAAPAKAKTSRAKSAEASATAAKS
ncbi:TrmB family transcriptional regulator [Deinococcus radiophilus]|uniref:TrmB family transcriptional regulator n=1 Tax=Deinococcus radiophilus TaxID=32062 RepID=UPI001E2CEF0D|nr:helix-turn-helix domain-containing protein [Deinococcus radiophilus]UFA50688.1 TrmB family transcriptional regulator [Deinococcus radiophilus]